MDTLVTSATTNELRITRRIPAPPEKVFAAWIEPAQVQQWMAPYGMTIPEAEIDPRPGGLFRTLMRDAAGKEYPNQQVIEVIEPPHRLVCRLTDNSCGPLMGAVGTFTFTAAPYGTKLDVRWRHPSEEMRAAHEQMGFFVGWGQTLDRLTAHVLAPAQAMPGQTPPAPQHGWLLRMLGDWDFQTEFYGAPGGEPARASGTESVRSLGGYWMIGEMAGECPGGGGPTTMIVQMGFDPATQRFQGTWVGSMMSRMSVYDGTLDEAAQVLTLNTSGPSMTGDGSTVRYIDKVEMVSDSERIVTSDMLAADGTPTRMMRVVFRRRD